MQRVLKVAVISLPRVLQLMDMILRHPAPPAPAHAAPPRTNTGMRLDTPGLNTAPPAVGPRHNGLISVDNILPTGAFLDGPGYRLGFSMHKVSLTML